MTVLRVWELRRDSCEIAVTSAENVMCSCSRQILGVTASMSLVHKKMSAVEGTEVLLGRLSTSKLFPLSLTYPSEELALAQIDRVIATKAYMTGIDIINNRQTDRMSDRIGIRLWRKDESGFKIALFIRPAAEYFFQVRRVDHPDPRFLGSVRIDRVLSMSANNNHSNSVEVGVNELIDIATKEYDVVRFWAKYGLEVKQMKEAFALAFYAVEALPSAPVAIRVEDMPENFVIDYLDAIRKANMAVRDLKYRTNNISTYFNIDDTTSTVRSGEDEVIHGNSIPAVKRVKYNETEFMNDRLQVVCDSYEKARLMLVREMKMYSKLVQFIIAGVPSREDEVLFNVRGELVTASRKSLLTTTTKRTFFDGLLSGGGWKTDAVGMCTIALKYDSINSIYK
jgi:hypothetical protein